jgi:PII-like signaling protein
MNGKLLELHMSDSDRHEGRPLYEVIVEKCRALNIAGATVFRGLEGYGPTAEINRHPVVVLIADHAEVIEAAAPDLEALMGQRLMAVSNVTLKRVTKS